jgi:hypothetical protein
LIAAIPNDEHTLPRLRDAKLGCVQKQWPVVQFKPGVPELFGQPIEQRLVAGLEKPPNVLQNEVPRIDLAHDPREGN